MAIVITSQTYVALELRVWQSEENYDLWVGWCPALDVYSQGASEAEARAAIESSGRCSSSSWRSSDDDQDALLLQRAIEEAEEQG